MTQAAEASAAAAAAPSSSSSSAACFTVLWRSVSKLHHGKAPDRDTTRRQMPGAATTTPPARKDLQSPNRRGCSRYAGLNNGDSPGDVEVSQDIFWDPTSPTQANTGSGHRNNRVVEISDIVNRIAPKGVRPKVSDSPLLQWIGDSAVPCTPEIPAPRVRKRSSRQNSVDDLMKLARQFDKNMQQDKEISERLNTPDGGSPAECGSVSEAKPADTSFPKDPAEAELRALFDCSTQRVSGPLSQGSAASACSPRTKDRPASSTSAGPRLSQKLGSVQAARPAEEEEKGTRSAKDCGDFDDDWENDDLVNDYFVLAMSQNPDQPWDTGPEDTLQSDIKTNTTTNVTSVCKTTLSTNTAQPPAKMDSKPSCSLLQELCPKPKTTNRSTFKLQSNPHFLPQTTARKVSRSSCAVTQPKSQMPEEKSLTTKTADDRTLDFAKDTADSSWDDGDDDDALLYQVCDSVERISNSQPQQASAGGRREQEDGQRKTTVPLPIDRAAGGSVSAGANRQSPRPFVRSNSLPGTSCATVNLQGWSVPMRGGANNNSNNHNNRSGMSQSLPGGRVSPGMFGLRRDSYGSLRAGNAGVDMKPHTVTAGAPQNSKSHHTAFKRNVSDSAATSSKVFVTSQMTGKCSAAEIQRKKQEALARRRLRMQNAVKP